MYKYYKYNEYEQEVMIGRKSIDDGRFVPAFKIRQNYEINGFELVSEYSYFREILKHEEIIKRLSSDIAGMTLKEFCDVLKKDYRYKEFK